MSNNNRETIADIVREMRSLGRLDERSTDKIPRSLQALGLRTYADRIEAAWKDRMNREAEIGKPPKKEEDAKYEYAIQQKFKGRWIIKDQGLPYLEEAKDLIRSLCKMYPTLTEAKFRVVRRPTDWEVVE